MAATARAAPLLMGSKNLSLSAQPFVRPVFSCFTYERLARQHQHRQMSNLQQATSYRSSLACAVAGQESLVLVQEFPDHWCSTRLHCRAAVEVG